MYSGSQDMSIRKWRRSDLQCEAVLKGHEKGVGLPFPLSLCYHVSDFCILTRKSYMSSELPISYLVQSSFPPPPFIFLH